LYLCTLNCAKRDTMDEELIQRIWEKGTIVPNYDPNLFRQDAAGAWIARAEWGNVHSPLGWEVDHIYPQSKGGTDELFNLRPIQWENNRSKGDDYPRYVAKIVSKENRNVEEYTPCMVAQAIQELIASHYGNH